MLKMKYFVLNPKAKTPDDIYARASRDAMQTYAEIIHDTNLELFNDLLKWVKEEARLSAMAGKVPCDYCNDLKEQSWLIYCPHCGRKL